MTALRRRRIRNAIKSWQNSDAVSLVMRVGGKSIGDISRTIESLIQQIYPNWELVLIGECAIEIKDHRIKRVAGNSLDEGRKLAAGEWVGILNAGDLLAEHALYSVADAAAIHAEAGIIYSDEDTVTQTGDYINPFFKPDWSPEYFLAFRYTGGLTLYRNDLVEKAGGFRSEMGDAEEYDLALRIIGGNAKVHHIRDILYHRRERADESSDAKRAIENYLQLIKRDGNVEVLDSSIHRVRYTILGNPKVSIVIPSACREITFKGRQTWFVVECVSSIRKVSTYQNIEIIVLDNNDMSSQLAEAIKPFDVRLVSFTEPFNLARKMNLGAHSAIGEQLILLNDDIEIISPDWIESMLEYSQWPEIGAVGVQLLFPDGTQQHTGVILLDGNPRHPFYHSPADHPGYFYSSQVHRNYSAVTGACMMTRADVFRAVGGFSESFPLNYNDVDYCLKVQQLGKRVAYMPYAKLYHHESVSKTGTHGHELKAFKKAWGKKIPVDPFYNPNLGRHFKIKV
jgi:GT2 family glycosyltransferase